MVFRRSLIKRTKNEKERYSTIFSGWFRILITITDTIEEIVESRICYCSILLLKVIPVEEIEEQEKLNNHASGILIVPQSVTIKPDNYFLKLSVFKHKLKVTTTSLSLPPFVINSNFSVMFL
jgi:hypothetical protein